MAGTSRLPLALIELRSRFGAATGVQTILGPPGALDLDRRELIALGVGYGENDPGRASRPRPQGLGSRVSETGVLRCVVSVVHGEGLPEPALLRVHELLGRLEDAVAADRKVGGLCAMAWIGPELVWSLLPTGSDGIEAAVGMDITCEDLL